MLQKTRQFLAAAALALLAIVPGVASATDVFTDFYNDPAGNPLMATDASGNVLWKASYQPFGQEIEQQAADADNTIGFHGKPFDRDTGLSYFDARYFNPMLNRFGGIDPVEFKPENVHSFNRYAYGNNNPYKFIDPDGQESEFINGYMAGFYNSISGPNSHANEIRDGSATFKVGAFIGLQLTPLAILASGEAASGVIATRVAATKAEGARDTLSGSLAPLKEKAPATVTGGYNAKTGEVAARACSGGKCAEDHVVDALGGNKADVRFTTAVRPRTGEQVPVCPRCEGKYGRDSFPSGTKFKTDQ